MPEHALEGRARQALADLAPEAAIGDLVAVDDSIDDVVSLSFDSRLPGYPGWRWTVSLATVGDDEPTVIETELVPGDGALLAPDWVPWSDRLAEYTAAQEAGAETGDEADESEDDDLDDADLEEASLDDEEDVDDDDLLGSDVLHGGDLDGVDIDDLDEADGDDDADDDEQGDEVTDPDER